jgi:hypothetical protein
MNNRKGYPTKKGFSDEPKQGCGVFAYGPEHRHIPELAVSLPDDENALIFQLIQLTETGFHAKGTPINQKQFSNY